ncbi:MAG: hypothetical protein ACC657_11210 [Thiohalomonadales bacterium]
MKYNFFKHTTGIILAIFFSTPVQAVEWSGNVAAEYSVFTESATDNRQHGNNLSISAEPEFYHEWQNNQSLLIKVFARWDEGDDERSHGDIREFVWQKVAENWELKVGIGKIYWGVTESQHLVDIINQTDLVESIDGEEKLGQPLINLSLIQSWGIIDIFVLPGFRERTFPGVNGRPRTIPYVDTSQAGYESDDEDKHIDYAVRWFNNIDEWDIGFSVFSGTSRDPRYILGRSNQGEPVFIPYYDLITQLGLDVQGTFDSWLWKLEWINRNGQGETYNAATAGLEYTFYGIVESDIDIGLLVEYLYDERGSRAITPFENDVLLGTRITFNDTQSTDLLIGTITDYHRLSTSLIIETSRRLSNNWKFNAEARFFKQTTDADPGNAFRNDDYLLVELEYYF